MDHTREVPIGAATETIRIVCKETLQSLVEYLGVCCHFEAPSIEFA
jgi:hypothetical protein